MSTETREVLVMGLPEAGKTTFIAALWHVVSAKEVESELQMADLQPSREHLNVISKKWRECSPVGRTILGKDRNVTMNLQTRDGSKEFRLTLPDTSGEEFTRIFENRRWTASFGKAVETSDAVMFFIHPDSLVVPHRIDDGVEDAVQKMEAAVNPAEGNGAANQEFSPWEVSRAAPQAKVLDLLQLVTRAKSIPSFKIVIVVSAWDLVAGEQLSPEEWLRKRAPLVWQFLSSNKERRPYSIYGVSAQGDDYAQVEKLREFIKPSERIVVASGQQASSDITRPLMWALG